MHGASIRSFRSWRLGLLAAVLAAAPLWSAPLAAQQRMVVVNGELLDAEGLAVLDALNCGHTVPDGVYWIDVESRTWGAVGDGTVLEIPDCAGAPEAEAPAADADDCESRYPVWEDRMMYCYGVNPNP